ncbi:receptor-like protein kinase HSL1 [Panicum miliaceum]|uniref:non-specific serine/threonine protein kinase n=1 Tax=Panicum miliaceum TaxID=4540 RepID=A0A3L6T3M5_PANMI|nr:receptor-like protein kinase HSL1 [Panicum miliaceum]
MATIRQRLLLAFLLLQLLAIAASSSDARYLIAARSALRDPSGALAGWSGGSDRGSPCRWARVSCAKNSTAAVAGLDLSKLFLGGGFPAALCSLRSLERLDLSANEFVGPLPACLAALPVLAHLNLAGNNFSGEVPPEWGAGFRSLLVLNLVQNLLSGEFPAFLTNLTALQEFSLAYNLFLPSPLPEKLGDLADLRVLFVANSSLNGIIPSSIGKLKNLVNLDISRNNIHGEIPQSIGNLSSLEQIELFANQLTGSIPVGFGGLKRLRSLDISMNGLTGEIPEDMFAVPMLASVHMYQNNLSGRVPETLGAAPSLSDLRIFGNQLSGPLPPEFGKNCPLQFLDISNNLLSGPIPATLCASRKLKQLMLLDNEFEGAIPVELGQCRTLTRVRLSNNRLSGSVPPEFWGLPGVYLLELRGNALSGTVDPAIAGAQNLSKLLLQDNRFTGALPAKLGTLPNLQEFKASNNCFSGPLPPSLANLSLLDNLDLSHNSFSGEIPRDFGRLKKLSQLYLSDNHLSGNVPPELGEIIEMNTLDLSNNELSGQVPAQLQDLRLTHFNISYNKLSGTLPVLFSGIQYQECFLGNPGLCHGFCQSNGNSDAKRHTIIKLVVYIFVAAGIILLLGLYWFHYKCRLYKISAAELDDGKSSWVLTSYHRVDFSEREIVNSLDESNVIGQGGSGKVYKAIVGPQGEAMAVKKLWPIGVASKRIDTFETEVATLSKVRHKNIVKLACSITNTVCRLLVYEYMPNGSLGDILHSAKRSILDWPMRYKIAISAAEGLSYLHHDCKPPIVHRDVKSNNILLDAEYGAKVADFGVAKTIGDGPATMSIIAGSCGYIAPEYAYTLHVTEKSDIYSFGVVMLELVTGKKPMAPEIGEMDLVTWVSATIEQNGLESVLEQTIAEQFKDEMCKVLKVALMCVSNLPVTRPPMRAVVTMLLEVKEEKKPKPKVAPLAI